MIMAEQRRLLLIIKMVLLLSVFALLLLSLALRGRVQSGASPAALQVAFVAQAVFAGVLIVVLRGLRAQPKNAAKLVPLTIVSWAVGESAAIVGAIVVLLGGPSWCMFGGLALFIVATRLNPIPA